jgi:glycosyltransferase domain-containing protein
MTPEEVELLSELTIVIPTCEKPENLERAIEYWRDTPITVHIVDGSEKPWFPIGAQQNVPTIFYHHVPSILGEHWLDNYVRRLEFATTLTKTKYSALCADDDAFAISGLSASIKLLENNLNFDAVVGQTLGFFPRENRVLWWLRYGASTFGSVFSWDAEALVRLKRSRLSLYYGIVRTDLWNMRIQILKSHAWLGYRWESLFQEVSRVMFRATSINQIVWFRFKTVRHSHEATFVQMREWARNKGNRHEVVSYVGILVEAIFLVNPTSDKGVVKERIHEFMKHHPESKGPYFRLNQIRKAFLLRLFLILDERVISGMPIFFREIVMRNRIPTKIRAAISSKKALSDFLPNLVRTGIGFEIDELQNLEQLWLKPREELRLRANI